MLQKELDIKEERNYSDSSHGTIRMITTRKRILFSWDKLTNKIKLMVPGSCNPREQSTLGKIINRKFNGHKKARKYERKG